MKLGFLGGSFNPPTIAHYNLIKQAKKQYKFDEVYFVPVNDYYNKTDLINIDKRIEMLTLICRREKRIKILDIEKYIKQKMSTYQILDLIRCTFIDDDVVFFMGEDNFLKMPTWKNYDKLQDFQYIIFQRNSNKKLEISLPNISYMENSENLLISSTAIRSKIAKGESISDLVLPEIEQYIKANRLYIK